MENYLRDLINGTCAREGAQLPSGISNNRYGEGNRKFLLPLSFLSHHFIIHAQSTLCARCGKIIIDRKVVTDIMQFEFKIQRLIGHVL